MKQEIDLYHCFDTEEAAFFKRCLCFLYVHRVQGEILCPYKYHCSFLGMFLHVFNQGIIKTSPVSFLGHIQ